MSQTASQSVTQDPQVSGASASASLASLRRPLNLQRLLILVFNLVFLSPPLPLPSAFASFAPASFSTASQGSS